MKAWRMTSEDIWAAPTYQEAAELFFIETGERADPDFAEKPLSDRELDTDTPATDESGAFTGETTTLRTEMAKMTEPGFLAGVW